MCHVGEKSSKVVMENWKILEKNGIDYAVLNKAFVGIENCTCVQ